MAWRGPVNEPPPPEVVTAAIAAYRPTRKAINSGGTSAMAQVWQKDVLKYLRSVGELFFGINWQANAISKVRFYIAKENEDGEIVPVEDQMAKDLMFEFFGDRTRHSEIARSMGFHYASVGEFWALKKPGEPMQILSVEEVRGDEATGYFVIRDRTAAYDPLTESEDVIRMWRADPGKRFEAISSVRAALPTLDEIHLMNMHIKRQGTSRLSSTGVALFPNEITLAGVEGETLADTLTRLLGQTAEYSTDHVGDPASAVPIVITAPGSTLDKFHFMKFWSELDDKALEIRRDAIRRLALALEMPPEVLLGTSGMTRWSTWALDESSVKASIDPLANALAHALTQHILSLSPDAVENRWIMQADTSELRLRPNRGREAIELWDRGLLSGYAARRENGFSANDAPNEEERKMWALLQVTKGSYSPLQSQAALKELGVDLDVDLSGLPPMEGRPDPSLQEHEDRLTADRRAFTVLAARAVERAGARLKNVRKSPRKDIVASAAHLTLPVQEPELDDLLRGAWDSAEMFCPTTCATLVPMADSYVRSILLSGTEFNVQDCERALSG